MVELAGAKLFRVQYNLLRFIYRYYIGLYFYSDSDLSLDDEYKGKGDKYGPTPSDSGDEYTDNDEYTDEEEEEIKKPLNVMGSDQYVDRVEKFTPAPGAPVSGYRPVPVRILLLSHLYF